MEVRLLKLELEGFRSFRERTVFEFPQGDSVVLINGKWIGSEVTSGTGKSSIMGALAFLLDISDSSIASLKNWYSKKMSVTGTFKVGDSIVEATRDPKLSLVIDGKEYDGLAKGAKEKLLEMLGGSTDVIEAITYRKQRKPGKIVNSTDSQIKEFLSGPLKLNEVEQAADDFTKKSNETTSGLELIKRDVQNLEMNLSMNVITQADLDAATGAVAAAECSVQPALAALENAKANLSTAQAALTEANAKVLQLSSNSAQADLQVQASQITAQANQIQAEISKINNIALQIQNKRRDNANLKESIMKIVDEIQRLTAGMCPTCSREWDKTEELRAQLTKNKDEQLFTMQSNLEYIKNSEPMLNELPALNQALAEANKSLAEVNRKMGEVSAPVQMARQNATNAQHAVNSAQSSVYTAESGVRSANQSVDNARKSLAALQARAGNYDSIVGKLAEAKKKLADQEREATVNALAAKMLGKTGFLGSIFDEILVDIEVRTNDMLQHFPNASQFRVHISSNKTIKTKGTVKKEISVTVSRDGMDVSLDDLSGGQQSAVELCSDLAAAEAVRARSGCALKWTCLDEVMDGLGSAEKEAVVSMIRQRVKGLVLMIEHATEIRESFDQVIEIEYDGRESRVVSV